MQQHLVDGAAFCSAAATLHASATNSDTDGDTTNHHRAARYDHTIGNCDAAWDNAAGDDATRHHQYAGEHACFDDRTTHADYD